MWLLTALFYSFQFFLRSSTNAMADQLMADFQIKAASLGMLASAYYVPYACLQIPVGVCLDVWGPKKVLRVGTLLCVVGAVIFGCANSFWMAYAGRLLIGAGAAVSFTGSIRMNTLWFAPGYLAFVVGLLSALGKIGSASAQKFLPKMVAYMGDWHLVIGMFSLWGLFLAILLWVFGKNGPDDHFVSGVKHVSWSAVGKQAWAIMRKPIIWAMGIYGYSLYLVLSVFADTCANGFLHKKMGMHVQPGDLIFWTPIGSAVGASLLSFLSDYFRRRVLILRISALMTLLTSLWVFFGPVPSTVLMQFLLFFLGFFSGGQILIFVISSEHFSRKLSGIAVGATNALLMAGGALHPRIVGEILEYYWDGTMHQGIPSYSLQAYQVAFSTLCLFFVIALIISLRVRESHPSRRAFDVPVEE